MVSRKEKRRRADEDFIRRFNEARNKVVDPTDPMGLGSSLREHHLRNLAQWRAGQWDVRNKGMPHAWDQVRKDDRKWWRIILRLLGFHDGKKRGGRRRRSGVQGEWY